MCQAARRARAARRLGFLIAVLVALPVCGARAESGYQLWLRYNPIDDAALRDSYRRAMTALVVTSQSPTGRAIRARLKRGLNGLFGTQVRTIASSDADGTCIVGTPESSPSIARLGWNADLARAGTEGYVVRTTDVDRHPVIVVASESEIGALRGAFHFLRLLQTRQPLGRLNIEERPRIDRRLLNHWDNLDGTIERGYAGRSLW